MPKNPNLKPLMITVSRDHTQLMNSASGDSRINYSAMIRVAIEKTYSDRGK